LNIADGILNLPVQKNLRNWRGRRLPSWQEPGTQASYRKGWRRGTGLVCQRGGQTTWRGDRKMMEKTSSG